MRGLVEGKLNFIEEEGDGINETKKDDDDGDLVCEEGVDEAAVGVLYTAGFSVPLGRAA